MESFSPRRLANAQVIGSSDRDSERGKTPSPSVLTVRGRQLAAPHCMADAIGLEFDGIKLGYLWGSFAHYDRS
jgi:hypothetical protein